MTSDDSLMDAPVEPASAGATRQRTTSTPAMSRSQRGQYAVLVGVWSAALLFFWVWWLMPKHVGNPALFWYFSIPLFYIGAVLPGFYAFYLFHMRRPVPVDAAAVQRDGTIGRVAVITLTVPGSESVDIVERQLAAMSAISFDHDSWILVDKIHSPEIESLAKTYGVRYFCRHDTARWGSDQVAAWNQDSPPFQAKTKAGNVNSWLSEFGAGYTNFTQFDIDHNPSPTYLDEVLGYFQDPAVAWVQAPSVYKNLDHWTARGSAEQEVVLQGPLQMGFFGFCGTPFIIGSHCTYDMHAVLEIGGFQPTRAEDHLDTVVLASHGYRGVFVPDVIAEGDGPETFDTYLAQQFAWAYSMIQVLFRYTPRLLRRYTPRQALQFVFVQTWYTFWSVSMLLLFTAPLASLFVDAPISRVSLWNFLEHSLPIFVMSTVIWYWSRQWHKPARVRLSWRGVILHVARWVVVLSALVQVIFRVKKPYMITVKGVQDARPQAMSISVLAPYVAAILLSLAACWSYLARDIHSRAQGSLFFALQGALLFVVLLATVWVQDFRSLRPRVTAIEAARLGTKGWAVLGGLSLLVSGTAVLSAGRILQALHLSGLLPG